MTLLKKRTNQYYYGNVAKADYLANLRSMGKPLRVVKLSPNNGHVCEEIPLCHQPAAYALVFRGETVNLCAEAYGRWKETK